MGLDRNLWSYVASAWVICMNIHQDISKTSETNQDQSHDLAEAKGENVNFYLFIRKVQ